MAKSIVNLSDTIATWVTKTNQTVNRLGDVANLTTSQDSSLVGAINGLDSDIKDLLDSNLAYIRRVDSDMGTRTSLITTDKEDLVSSINEVKAQVDALDSATNSTVGDLTNLTDSAATLVDAVNALTVNVDSNYTLISALDSALDSNNTNFVSRVRGSISASGDLTYNSSTGDFSIDVEQVYTAANFDSDLGTSTSQSTVRGFVSATDAGGDGSFSYNSGTGVFTYTGPSASEVRAHFSATAPITLSSGVIAANDATTSTKGIASFSSSDFTVTSGAVSLAKDPVITLTGAVTGSGTMTNLGSVSITTTATSDPVVTVTLTGDVTGSGSATLTNLGNGTASFSTSLAANTVTSSELSGATALIIYNSAGTAVKTLYGAGS